MLAFWIIKLMDRRDNPGVTFEASRAALGQRLAVGSRERQRDALIQALRRAARIEYRPYGTRGGDGNDRGFHAITMVR